MWKMKDIEWITYKNGNSVPILPQPHCQQTLESGTKINFPGYRGEIIKSNIARDQFGIIIVNHDVKLTEKYNSKNGEFEKIEPVFRNCNYSDIYLLINNKGE